VNKLCCSSKVPVNGRRYFHCEKRVTPIEKASAKRSTPHHLLSHVRRARSGGIGPVMLVPAIANVTVRNESKQGMRSMGRDSRTSHITLASTHLGSIDAQSQMEDFPSLRRCLVKRDLRQEKLSDESFQ
jgi:hypothetical protein